MIHFQYADLVQMAKDRPKGYLKEVMSSARKVGGDVIMTDDAYYALREKYSKPTLSIREKPTQPGNIIVPGFRPPRLLGPTGRPLAKSCCGGR